MGKRKRPQNRALTQEEIWDDSALVRHWDEAVQEYEFYHSIAARGEDVEEVLRQAEIDEQAEREAELTSWPKKAKIEKGTVDRDVQTTVVESEQQRSGDDHLAMLKKKVQARKAAPEQERTLRRNGSTPARVTTTEEDLEDGEVEDDDVLVGTQRRHDPIPDTTTMPAPIPSPGTSSSKALDPASVLENIKMAYWWAGYYSGLHEGMQQAGRPSSTQV